MDKGETASGRLLRQAAALEPPMGTQERIWRRLTEPAARLAEAADESAAVVETLRAALEIEPPPGAQARIWQRLVEERAIHEGAEPHRLVETDDFVAKLLARAAETEPAFGKQARILRAVRESAPRRMRWAWPVGALGMAMAALLLVMHARAPQPNHAPTALIEPSLALTVPGTTDFKVVRTSPIGSGRVSLARGDKSSWRSGAARVKAAGVGDITLGLPGTTVQLVESDAHGVKLALEQGRISVHADKRHHDAPLVIEAQGVDVEVVGTIFSVETSPEGPRVYVREGLVRVTSSSGAAMVGANQAWPASEEHFAQWATDAMATLAGPAKVQVSAVAAPIADRPETETHAAVSRSLHRGRRR